MKSAVETLEPTRARLTVEVPFEELKPSLDKAYQEIARQVNVPGFRRGKVPPPVIDRQLGRGAVLDQAINEALPQLYMAALQENQLVPLAQPDIDITRLEDNEVLEFTAEVTVRPTIELPSYDAVSASVDDVEVTDADVDEQVQALRERFATLSEVQRPAAEGDFVSIDLAASKDGEAVEGGQLEDYSYRVGKGDMLPGIDDVLVGMSAGEDQSFTTQLLGGDMEGQDVEVVVTVGSVKEQELPELDEDFAQTASEFDTMEELTEDVRTRLGRGKRLEQAAAARDAVLEQLIEATEVPLPDEVVTAEIASRRQEIEQQLGWAGMDMQTYLDNEKQTVDEFEADLDKRVRDMLAAQFILDEIAKVEQIEVEQEELSQHLMQRAQQSGQDPNEFISHMLEHNHVPEMVAEVVRGKALAQIVQGATVTDASGRVVDLENLQPDGSIGAPEPEVEDSGDSADATGSEAGSATAVLTDEPAEGPAGDAAGEPAQDPDQDPAEDDAAK